MNKLPIALLFFLLPVTVFSQETSTENIAYIIPIHGEINPSRMVFIRRGIQKAESAGAGHVIFDIDTFGGRVDSALQIATLIGSASDAITIAFVPASAEGTGVSWSAGALISFACARIYMGPGTSIGAAAPVYQTQAGMEMAPEKTVSAIRTQMAALAEKNGYPTAVALAMVDMDVELVEMILGEELLLSSIDDLPDLERQSEQEGLTLNQGKTVSRSGKLLTLTAGEMEKYGISSGTYSTIDDLLVALQLRKKNAVFVEETIADRAAAFITGTFLTSLLVLAGLVALYLEITSPGFGIPGAVAIICFAVVFLGSALLGTVGSLELLMFIAGVVLLVVEIFLIPGFGVTGVSGILFIAIALVLSRQDFVWPEFTWEWDVFRKNLITVGLSVVGSLVAFGTIIRLFPHLPLFRRLILVGPNQKSADIATSEPAGVASVSGADLPSLGSHGHAVTTLRPVGKAEFETRIYVVKSDSEYIDSGSEVEIVSTAGNHILVRRI